MSENIAPRLANPQIERVSPDVKTIAWFGGYLLLSVILVHLPGRLALAHHEAQFGFDPAAYVFTALAVDIFDFLWVFVALNLIVALLVRLAFRRWVDSFANALRRTIVPTTSVLFLVELVGAVWGSEHKIERGLYPTMFEFVHAMDSSFAMAGAHVFTLARFAYTTVFVLLALAVASGVLRWKLRNAHEPSGGRLVLSLGLATGLITLTCFGIHRASPLVFSSIPHWRTVESPLRIFLAFGVDRENIRHGSVWLFQNLEAAPSDLVPGAALLGLPTDRIDRLSEVVEPSRCQPHPLAVPLAPPAPEGGEQGVYHHELHVALDELSRALFEGRSGPVRVWMLALESLRADDIHALHERAHPDVVPFMGSLYEEARKGGANAIVAERMYQAGARTSQGLAAMTCGLGTMPFGLSASRDLGLLPLRCLPDLLADASFRTAYYYGSNPGFDNMLAFLNHHGFDRIKSGKDYVEAVPHAGWSVPDWIVFEQGFQDSEREPPSQSQLNFAMSLTNHFPFKRPEDFPALVADRVAKAVSGRGVGKDDVARLETLSYTDWAFERLVKKIGDAEVAKQTILVAAADHSTTDYFLWREGRAEQKDRWVALSRIPFAMVLPDAFLEGSSDPQRARAAVRRVNQLMAESPLSQNDIPRIVLALLLHSEPLRSMPEPWRWHTLGGQRLSPGARIHNYPDAVTMGIDAASKVYVVTRDGALKQTDESAVPLFDLEAAKAGSETLRPATSVFSSLLRGYGKNCWASTTIRMQP